LQRDGFYQSLFLLLRPVPVKTAVRPSVFRICNEFGVGNVF